VVAKRNKRDGGWPNKGTRRGAGANKGDKREGAARVWGG
jgi:hypothetical protein